MITAAAMHMSPERPRWLPENRPYVDTSKPANGAEPGHLFNVRKKNAPWNGKAGENSMIWDAPSPKFIMGGSDEEKYNHPTQKPGRADAASDPESHSAWRVRI